MVYDFHTHTFYSDSELSPVELARRAVERGYRAIALTDHVAVGGLHELVGRLQADRELIERFWPIRVVIGVELTHLPPEALFEAANLAGEAGAELIVLHGETLVEPVLAGTVRAGITTGLIDVIAHPGLISEEEVRLAKEFDVYLELCARCGHALTNGHVAKLALQLGARLLVNSDAHAAADLLTPERQRLVALGAGVDETLLPDLLHNWPEELLQRAIERREASRA
uniref:Histidinol phosphate phosphatase domain-containing protein n=1 Tax=Thermorudis peleae TaxID=1382356 RepID=A0A831TBV8_9BACT